MYCSSRKKPIIPPPPPRPPLPYRRDWKFGWGVGSLTKNSWGTYEVRNNILQNIMTFNNSRKHCFQMNKWLLKNTADHCLWYNRTWFYPQQLLANVYNHGWGITEVCCHLRLSMKFFAANFAIIWKQGLQVHAGTNKVRLSLLLHATDLPFHLLVCYNCTNWDP